MEILKKFYNKRYIKLGIPVLIGALGGYLYYYFIGCRTGACPISSNPLTSIVYGVAMGALFIPKGALSFKNNQKG